ncbi:MAG: iron uptake porin [Spirulina sp. SIO3F2]|nr:iron uptake porin [Spirulina sp. SIO3F2]
MTIKNLKLRHLSPALMGMTLALSTAVAPAANAQTATEIETLDQVNVYSTEDINGSMGQGLPGAAQFSDVSPNDWAYQALDDLVRRYDCLKGYPNGTYRGNRALSRYEFAAGLNACLQQIERLIAASTADFVTRSDLEALQRLIQEFEAELATLGTRVDALESRVAFLEDHQFSTTTKLVGEVIFALTSDFSDGLNNSSASGVANAVGEAVFGDRVRLELNTSFTGEDRLVTRLATGNLTALSVDTGTNTANGFESTQTFNLGNNNNNVAIDWLAYYFPFQDSQAYVAATGGIWSDIAPTLNPYFEDYDGGDGALSTFATESPIYRIGGGAGAAFSFGFSPIESILGPSTVTIGYLASQASTANEGLFSSDYAAFAQLNGNLSDRIGFGLTYVHGYHKANNNIFAAGGTGTTSSVVGTSFANNPVGSGAYLSGNTTSGIASNSYGAEVAFRPSDSISVSGFATWTDARVIGTGDADIWTFGAGLAFPDLGKEGSVLGIFGGAQPTLRGVEGNVNRAAFDPDFSWHIEAFYKYQLNDSISITPGLIWLTDPNQASGNSSDAVIGTLRTTFSF